MLLIMNIPLIGLFTRMLTIPLWFLVNRPISGMFMISSITLAISRAAISPQTISGCSVRSGQ
jgi:TctA family transporter